MQIGSVDEYDNLNDYGGIDDNTSNNDDKCVIRCRAYNGMI